MSESTADDDALYNVWGRLDAAQVATLHALVDWLGARWDDHLKGEASVPLVWLVLVARHLEAFDLGHLPFVAAVLAEGGP